MPLYSPSKEFSKYLLEDLSQQRTCYPQEGKFPTLQSTNNQNDQTWTFCSSIHNMKSVGGKRFTPTSRYPGFHYFTRMYHTQVLAHKNKIWTDTIQISIRYKFLEMWDRVHHIYHCIHRIHHCIWQFRYSTRILN